MSARSYPYKKGPRVAYDPDRAFRQWSRSKTSTLSHLIPIASDDPHMFDRLPMIATYVYEHNLRANLTERPDRNTWTLVRKKDRPICPKFLCNCRAAWNFETNQPAHKFGYCLKHAGLL